MSAPSKTPHPANTTATFLVMKPPFHYSDTRLTIIEFKKNPSESWALKKAQFDNFMWLYEVAYYEYDQLLWLD